MSTVTRRVLIGAAVAAVAVLGIAVGLGREFDQRPSSPRANMAGLQRLDLNPLGTLGAPGRLRKLSMSNPSGAATLPAELTVYQVVPAVVTPGSVEKEARRFGVAGKAQRNVEMTSVRSASGDVVVDNLSGSVNWVTPEYEEASEPMQHRLTDDEYVTAAKEFMRGKDLWNDDLVFAGVSEYTVNDAPMMVEVHFTRTLNGRNWHGVGPKKTVTFGDNGKVVGYFSVWREVKPMTKYPLVKPADAVKQIERGDALVAADELNADATAERIELVYINDGAGIKQRYVAPYYRVSGKTASGKPFTAVTRAIPLELVNERPEELPGLGGTAASTGRTE